jgi:hypothetical protein
MTDEFIVKEDGFRGWIFRQDETTRLVAEFHGAPPGAESTEWGYSLVTWLES